MSDTTFVTERSGVLRVIRSTDVAMDAIQELLAQPGITLKRNKKSHTRRVRNYVLKSSEGAFPAELIRHTINRDRYRRAWNAAIHLAQYGIEAPRPVAHVEWSSLDAIWQHTTITTYIEECVDVEHFYDVHLREAVDASAQAAYLGRLADAVNAFVSSGAVHTDLAGKNILTRNGEVFHFIDLDGVLLNTPYDEPRQLQLHVQLYDSFIDRCSDAMLAPFIASLQPRKVGNFDSWMERVKAAQQLRRAKTVAAWKREGKMV